MSCFVKGIKINELFHLKGIEIPIEQKETPHLIITGKNGSGKTVLLNALATFLEHIKDAGFRKTLTSAAIYSYKVYMVFCNLDAIIRDYEQDEFIIVFYPADRKSQMHETQSPTKPNYTIKGNVRQTATAQFLNFLSDLKIQEALARNEQETEDADQIHQWFIDFEQLLKQIYQDEELKLEFNYKDYSFRIHTEGKRFKFTEMSDGFAAILDIVADLILKMQTKNNITRVYQKKGIVLIDEVETHLHLELQRIIMPILTRIFPNIQFIITTHSPFVLSSMDNAVAFDLEHQEIIDELTDYSYEALAEGYFGVRTESSYMEMQLNTLKELLAKENLTMTDKQTIKLLSDDFEKIPESISPSIVGNYLQLKNQYAPLLKELLQ